MACFLTLFMQLNTGGYVSTPVGLVASSDVYKKAIEYTEVNFLGTYDLIPHDDESFTVNVCTHETPYGPIFCDSLLYAYKCRGVK